VGEGFRSWSSCRNIIIIVHDCNFNSHNPRTDVTWCQTEAVSVLYQNMTPYYFTHVL
jgi:hypothetical protein